MSNYRKLQHTEWDCEYHVVFIPKYRRKFWARGYFVSTVGRDEEVTRQYIRNQENEDQRQDQLKFS